MGARTEALPVSHQGPGPSAWEGMQPGARRMGGAAPLPGLSSTAPPAGRRQHRCRSCPLEGPGADDTQEETSF